jgi:hypothetical protein
MNVYIRKSLFNDKFYGLSDISTNFLKAHI